MSKLNASRIVNLNYNRNTMRINNETFEYGGENTLMSLRNGGGKTVMVQMLLSLFVSARYRDLKDRKFISYFTSSSPTYIMTEWLLDNNSGFVLIGMGVRKKTYNLDEEVKDELEIVTFIHEYQKGNEFDIHNLPVLEKIKNGVKVKSLSKVKETFEELKVSRKYIFDYYDLSNDYQRKRYFERLKEYNINHHEWESIIRKINMKESGLSELFNESKTIPALIRDWFLNAIEDKLNEKENRIKKFQEILNKFILELKENESKIELKKGIKEFKDYGDKILSSAGKLKTIEAELSKAEISIARLYKFISKSLEKLEEEKLNLEDLKTKLNSELDEIEYEKLSYEYYRIIESIEENKQEEAEIKEELNQLKHERYGLNKELGILECAKIYSDYLDSSKEVQILENDLENSAKKDEVKQIELNNVGFTLKERYSTIVQEDKKHYENKLEEINKKEQEIGNSNQINEKKISEINFLEADIAKYKEKVNYFNKLEEKFAANYKDFSCSKNIMGEYETEHIKAYEETLLQRINEAEEQKKSYTKAVEEAKISVEDKRTEREQVISDLQKSKLENNNSYKTLEDIEQKCGQVKNILIYSGIKEDKIFEKEYIVEIIKKNLEKLSSEKAELNKEVDKLKQEQLMYESGKNIRLPEEFEKSLNCMDIPIVYGLTWLKKQALTIERKTQLIKNNPFLPYSLIMSSPKIELLKTSDLKICTSSPIPIIEQEALEKELEVKVVNNLYTIGKLNFYIAFNEKLLNEEELVLLIDNLKKEIIKNNDLIIIKQEESNTYSNHLYTVKDFFIKEKDIKDLTQTIKRLEDEIAALEQKKETLQENIDKLLTHIKASEGSKEKARVTIDKLNIEKDSFSNLMVEYEDFKKNRQQLNAVASLKDKCVRERNVISESLASGRKNLDAVKEASALLRDNYRSNEKKAIKYESYKQGELIIGDLDYLESSFESLNKAIGTDIKYIRERLERENKTFKKLEKALISTQNKYSLKEEDYKQTIYDEFREKLNTEKIERLDTNMASKNEEERKVDRLIAGLESDMKNKLKAIGEKFNLDCPKDTNKINNTDFEGRKRLKKEEISGCTNLLKENGRFIGILTNNKNKLDSFSQLPIEEAEEMSISFMEIEALREKFIKEHSALRNEYDKRKDSLGDSFDDLTTSFRYKNEEAFKNAIDTLLDIKFKPEAVIKTLEVVYDAHSRMLKKLESDLLLLEQEESVIISSLLDYTKEVYDHLNIIDDNSTLKINDKPYRMLEIEQPEWKEETSRIIMRDYISGVIRECKTYLNLGKGIDDVLQTLIKTEKLYDNVVHINEVNVKLYKIETSKPVRISWNEVAENSGGEGFVSAFIILVSLLSYMRKEEDSLVNTKEEGKVIIMDNPFAQTNAEHLLRPLVDIAKKYNTQLICFSGLGGDSIYNRFDNIHVLNLIDSKVQPGIQILESEHKKGEEKTSLTSTRFLMQYEKYEQETLF